MFNLATTIITVLLDYYVFIPRYGVDCFSTASAVVAHIINSKFDYLVLLIVMIYCCWEGLTIIEGIIDYHPEKKD
jgi:hypothetical protein